MGDGVGDEGRSRTAEARQVRRGGLRALGATMPGLTRRALGTRSLAEGALIAEWSHIVGPGWAAVCQPRAIRFSERGRRAEGTLVLRVQPGEATRLQHEAPWLVERVNGFFGYRAVARLRLEQAPLGHGQRSVGGAPRRAAARALEPEVTAAVRARVAGVDDEELRRALERLGGALAAGGGERQADDER